ncbi:hypothetical protein ACQUSY_12420 [Microbacterium sp. YY-03]|uniref:hypothetical protein n=1 Tax=Microbacterium sp. YY-03 TaxID=3421636 RepID=UPI003D175542
MLTPESGEPHPWVTYTAITLAATDPAFRAILGSSRAQADLDSWAAYTAPLTRQP